MIEIQLPDTRSMKVPLDDDAPGLALTFVLRALSFEEKGDLVQAIDAYSAALRISPYNAQLLYRLGLAFDKKGDCDRAITSFDEALRISPAFVEALYARGNAWMNKHRIDRAIEDYDAVLRLNLNDWQAINILEDALMEEISVSA